RFPATTTSQSSISALGTNLLNSSTLSFLDIKICSMEYLIKGMFFAPAANNVPILFILICLKKSIFEPFFQNLGRIAANGPNNKTYVPSTHRLSKVGTVIGGVPTGSLPYAFAWCCFTISGSSQYKHSPDIGKPPRCLLCFIFVFCNSGMECPPAPMNKKSAL